MNPKINYDEITILRTNCQFIFPFSWAHDGIKELTEKLLANGFEFFSIENVNQQNIYYGESIDIPHKCLNHYFMPYIEQILFPDKYKEKAINRYSKPLNLTCRLETVHNSFSMKVHSIDIYLCPFSIGMVTIRTDPFNTNGDISLSDALDFMDHFRVLEPSITEEKGTVLYNGEKRFDKTQDFIFQDLCPFIVPFIEKSENDQSAYLGSLPYFIDERMFVSSFLTAAPDDQITNNDLFRIGHMNGYKEKKQPYTSASNQKYIEKYVNDHVYDRWSPDSFHIISDHTFTCISRDTKNEKLIAEEMYGQLYYNLILHLFYKIVLLKLSYSYSQLYIDQKQEKMDKLIRSIANFTAKYIFSEISSRTEGQELSVMMKDRFKIETLYKEVINTMDSLYQNQEKLASKRHNSLLLILTTYTVISGIYGMNLVIEDWRGKIEWSKLAGYSVFEYISLVVALSGIAVGSVLAGIAIMRLLKDYFDKGKSENLD
ncbi:hypothetical protein [Bacillus sp. V2I10]|uniref:hypothetical protein n=1 Tax=Bacillus sp. V2I10 TaxID=3042276 RepID=UPI00277DC993|nr:hypothetical protein [Bacillus sp. V2I10]MDQ0859590.1 hypothetical protein [Bacillus sp. V2I10]